MLKLSLETVGPEVAASAWGPTLKSLVKPLAAAYAVVGLGCHRVHFSS